ncbi:helix-turn-helix transcriptional regulator [Desulfatitalea alkaliphila]|uniref:Transcriptional regulator n=1 Tax=Desulfatitalea alkaliphila TaxID=2929485 RepID=A0AA41ULC8_9BACT|nr:transcriptional regulator [Desulfatitalea alkaliphila]MCJ8501361.1 transcriptional regulator [Desulfatitalea alkaliphila]
MMRGDQLSRQWRVLRQLESAKNGMTAARIAETSAVSLRTAYRDLYDLQLAGFPLYTEKEGKASRWRLMEDYRFKIPEPFTLTELLCLHLGGDLLDVFQGTVFQSSQQSVLEKIRAMLPPETLAYLDRIRAAYRMGGGPCKNYGRFSEVIGRINQAVADGRTLELGYWSLRSNQRTSRRVDPYKIWFYDDTIYLIGHCHLRDEVRTFVVDRINMLHLTDDRFEIPADFSFDAYIRNSFKVMQEALQAVIIRISPAWARWVEEKVWHKSQQIQKLIDGGIEISFSVAGLDEIRQWVLSLGPEAVVLAPEELKQDVRQSLQQALEQYGGALEEASEPAISGRKSRVAS